MIATNWLIKVSLMVDLFGILVYVNVNIREYLDYANCKCRKGLIDKLVKECNEDIDENEIVYNVTLRVWGLVHYT